MVNNSTNINKANNHLPNNSLNTKWRYKSWHYHSKEQWHVIISLGNGDLIFYKWRPRGIWYLSYQRFIYDLDSAENEGKKVHIRTLKSHIHVLLSPSQPGWPKRKYFWLTDNVSRYIYSTKIVKRKFKECWFV